MATKKGIEVEEWELCDSENATPQQTDKLIGGELCQSKVVSELQQEVATLRQQIKQMQIEVKTQLSKENLLSLCSDVDLPTCSSLQKQQNADQLPNGTNRGKCAANKLSTSEMNMGKPEASSIWAISNLGEIFVQKEKHASKAPNFKNNLHIQEIDLTDRSTPVMVPLDRECVPGTEIIVTGFISEDAERMSINLVAQPTNCQPNKADNINFHFNPRFENDPYETDVLVRNTMIEGRWDVEERKGGMPFELGKQFSVRIINGSDYYTVYVNDEQYCTYKHRLSPYGVTAVSLWQDVEPSKVIIKYPAALLNSNNVLCQQLGGHLKKVESCNLGVTWGIGYDNTIWVYNGGWGGSFFGNTDGYKVKAMVDHEEHSIDEKQRWNAITGYSPEGLMNDDIWNSEMDKEKSGQDLLKLLSVDWQWVSDWKIDFQLPGVDSEGWQYSVNSSSVEKPYVEYLRKRRWHRRCAIKTKGPWLELKDFKLLDVSLEPLDGGSDSVILVWAIASDGQIVTRTGVSQSNPMGETWEYVSSDQTFTSVSCGPYKQVWAVAKNGSAYCRIGIGRENVMGDSWECVPALNDVPLKQVSAGQVGLWAVDICGNLHVRQGITPDLPLGTHWRRILAIYDTASSSAKCSFEQVSAGRTEVWAITSEGKARKRVGISSDNAAGVGWSTDLRGKWQHFTTRAVL